MCIFVPPIHLNPLASAAREWRSKAGVWGSLLNAPYNIISLIFTGRWCATILVPVTVGDAHGYWYLSLSGFTVY